MRRKRKLDDNDGNNIDVVYKDVNISLLNYLSMDPDAYSYLQLIATRGARTNHAAWIDYIHLLAPKAIKLCAASITIVCEPYITPQNQYDCFRKEPRQKRRLQLPRFKSSLLDPVLLLLDAKTGGGGGRRDKGRKPLQITTGLFQLQL